MATLNEKLADSIKSLSQLTGSDGSRRIFKTAEINRTDRERLLGAGYLKEVMRGWLMTTRPGDREGDTTAWYTSFWEFCRKYLDDRFGSDWTLAAESSAPLLADNLNVPEQLIVSSPKANNQNVHLLHDTSLYLLRARSVTPNAIKTAGMRTPAAPEVLCNVTAAFWEHNKNDVIALLGSIRATSSILTILLAGGRTVVAGRIAGAYRILGNARAADDIISAMQRAGHNVREDSDPFKAAVSLQFSGTRVVSPIVSRIRLMWSDMRENVIKAFELEPRTIEDKEQYLAAIDDRYASDAYHSLSIEGYRVTEELIEKVRNGTWDPDSDEDREHKNAMAAKGYWDAFQVVRKSVAGILDGADAAVVAEEQHLNWYRALFQPSLEAGIVKPENLAGYRQHFVGIRGSSHTPVNWESVPDAMEAFFECLKNEKDPRIRAILGHFIFTFIHPLPDGNGRAGRFLMNTMLASAGLPWTIIPVDRRDEYMKALEDASVRSKIEPFARFVADCTKHEPPPPRRSRPGEKLKEANLDAASGPTSTP